MTGGNALATLNAERSRQRADAYASYMNAREQAVEIAAAIRGSNRLVLSGMGGSHFVNRIVEPFYRDCGIDATSHTATELLQNRLPGDRHAILITSQSGASSEVRELLTLTAAVPLRFGLTLEPDSPLAKAATCLVGVGGTERSFAAARSILVTLALHASVLQALGSDQADAIEWLEHSTDIEADGPCRALCGVSSIIFSAPAGIAGVAELAALTTMELARMPVMALEYGQFRHGPMEALGTSTGVVLLQIAGHSPEVAAEIAGIASRAGAAVMAIDGGGQDPTPSDERIAVPIGPGLARPVAMLLACQCLAIAVASRRVPDVGEPRVTRKVM